MALAALAAGDLDLPYRHVLDRPAGQDPDFRDSLDHVEALDDAAEDRVLAVEVRRRRDGDEELRAVRVGTVVGHRDHAGPIEPKARDDLVPEGSDVGKVPGARGIPRLDRESLEHAV